MTSEKVQTILGTDGAPVGVFVPIEVWREMVVQISSVPATTNGTGNGTHGTGADVPAKSAKPRLRDRPLTEEQLRIKEQLDTLFATEDNRLDPVMAEIQAQSLHFEDEL